MATIKAMQFFDKLLNCKKDAKKTLLYETAKIECRFLIRKEDTRYHLRGTIFGRNRVIYSHSILVKTLEEAINIIKECVDNDKDFSNFDIEFIECSEILDIIKLGYFNLPTT